MVPLLKFCKTKEGHSRLSFERKLFECGSTNIEQGRSEEEIEEF